MEGTSKAPIDFIIKGDIPDVGAFGRLFNLSLENWPDLAVNLAGGFDRNKITLRRSSVAVNGTNIDLSGDYDWGHGAPVLNLTINAGDVELGDVVPGL